MSDKTSAKREYGILLHISSLPSRYGIGDLGDEAYRFVDLLIASGQDLWQILPLGPTSSDGSPYQGYS
ncbi:MAG: 4-alpha-glucanotransferase, partial [Desulfitobacteriaceae bacterium]|nr:4-alpha-glucanotransferase [Desulfitobacteriaceae bacterium]